MMTVRRYGAVSALAAVAVVASACGGGGSSPSSGARNEVLHGLRALRSGSQLTVTLKSGVTPAEITALGGVTGHAAPAAARVLLTGSSISIAVRTTSGQALSAVKSPTQEDADILVDLGGAPLFELRLVNAVFYAHLDAAALGRVGDSSAEQRIRAEARHFAQIPAFRAFFSGQWISLSYQQIRSIESQIPGGSTSTGQGSQILAAIEHVFTSDTTFTKVGSRAGGTLIAMTGNVRTLVSGLVNAIKSAEPLIASRLNSFHAARVPSRNVTVDAVVRGGVLQQFSLNLAQFASATERAKLHGMALPLDADFSQSAPAVTAPTGATPVNLGQLFGALAGSGISGSSSSGST
jgi:hypothetical protein